MAFTPTHHDLLLCTLARQRELLSDGQLESAVCQWLVDPQRPLIDVFAVHGKLSEEQRAALEATAMRHAAETCADPLSSRLESLPSSVRRLLMPHTSDVTLVSEGQFDTRPADSKRRGGAAPLVGLTPGDRFDIQ